MNTYLNWDQAPINMADTNDYFDTPILICKAVWDNERNTLVLNITPAEVEKMLKHLKSNDH